MLSRSLLLSSGTVLGIMPNEDRSSTDILVLEPSGGCVSVVHGKQGVIKKHVTRFVTGRIREGVKQLLEFRNTHCGAIDDATVYVAQGLMEQGHYHGCDLTAPLRHARWPTTTTTDVAAIVTSIDEFAQCMQVNQFEGEGWILIPILPAPEEKVGMSNRHTPHVWIRRSFSLDHPPKEFQWPMARLLSTLPHPTSSPSYITCPLPVGTPNQHDASWEWAESHSKFLLELCWYLAAEKNPDEDDLSILSFVTWNPSLFVLVDSCKHYVIRVHPATNSNPFVSVRCTSSDGTCQFALNKGDFFSFIHSDGKEDVYAPGCIPHFRTLSPHMDKSPSLSILGEHLERLKQLASRQSSSPHSTKNLAPIDVPTSRTSQLTGVVEDKIVIGLGRFTAFVDGSMRAVFDDRTILTRAGLEAKEFSILTPQGVLEHATIRVPGKHEIRLHTCIEFLQWAHRTPAERFRVWSREQALRDSTHDALQRASYVQAGISRFLESVT